VLSNKPKLCNDDRLRARVLTMIEEVVATFCFAQAWPTLAPDPE
jgi:hypothetical protein